MVTIRPLVEELKSLGLIQEERTQTTPTAERKVERRSRLDEVRRTVENLRRSYRTSRRALSEMKDPKERIRRLFEELEELVDEPVEPEGEKSKRIMKDVGEIAEAILRKYGKHEEVREVFEMIKDTATALGNRLVEMDDATSEKEVRKVVSAMVDALEWLLEEFEPVTSKPLQYGDPESPGERRASQEPDRPEEVPPELPPQPGAGSPVESKKR